MRSKKALYNIVANLVLQVVALLNGFIIPKVIIDTFGSDVNGLVTSITQFLGYISLLESGFGPVVKASLYKVIAKKDKVAIASILKASEIFFRRIAVIFLLYIAVLCIVFPLIARADFDVIFTASLVVIIAVSTFAEYFFGMTYRLFLQAEQKTYVVSLIQVVSYVLSIIVVVVLALSGQNILIIKLASGLIFMLRPLLQNYYVRKKYSINLHGAKKGYQIKQKWDGLAQHVAAVIRDNTDVAVLTIFTTLAEVSIYSIYYLVVAGIRRILVNINSSLDASFGDMIANGEDDNLRKKFSAYELIYLTTIATIFACAFVLITPFVSIYTKGVTDADYIQPVFGYLLVLSGLVFAILIPYGSLTLVAGHFKETRNGAWIEAGINIIVSAILVANFGLVGVAIGTVAAISFRMVEFIYHANKYILKRSIWFSAKKIFISVSVMALSTVIFQLFYNPSPTGYLGWLKDAFIIGATTMVISIIVFMIFCRKETKTAIIILKKIIKIDKSKKV